MTGRVEMWHEARERMRRERSQRHALALGMLLAMVLAAIGLAWIGG